MEQRYVGEILVRRGALDAERLEEALSTAADKGVGLADVLIATRVVEESALVKALADEMGMPFTAKIAPDEIPEELVEQVPINFARQHRVLPIGFSDGHVRVAVSDPLDPYPLDDVRALLGMRVDAVAVPGEAIEDAINRVYERKDETALSEGKEGEDEEELQDLIDMTDEAPVIRWVNNLFYNSVRERASDIHIEPTEREVIVRFRVDGKLIPRKTAHRGFLPSIVSRVKIEAGLNIAEKRLPQDGRITKKIAGKLVDVRVSTIPTAKGERVVMRLLDKQQVLLDLPQLGFDTRQMSTMTWCIGRPNGIILVTGPTGSGKTTTLYACLNKINTPEKNILTVEDPVEYELAGIGQMQVRPKIGLTFASGLRSFLRQDPDVIMVGEIRDEETADIAIHASLTGHLVLSTLHTNDAPSAVTRLIDMGVKPFLISSSVLAVLAQRLVRKLCPECRVPYEAHEEHFRELGVTGDVADYIERMQALVAETVRRESAPPDEGSGSVRPAAPSLDFSAGACLVVYALPEEDSVPDPISQCVVIPEITLERNLLIAEPAPHVTVLTGDDLAEELRRAESRHALTATDAIALTRIRRFLHETSSRFFGYQMEPVDLAGTGTAHSIGLDALERRDLDGSPTRIIEVPPAPIGVPRAGSAIFFKPGACEACRGTGYRGRVGIFELMMIDEPVRREILNHGDSNAIMRVAVQRGMRSLRDDGARQVMAGVTSLDEVLAATQAGDLE